MFSPLHQALGRPPGPIDDDMLNEAIGAGVEESDGLDFKKALPAEKELAKSDFPKDVAACANSGGGVLVFGVAEEQRKATGRVDVGEVTESYERTLRRVAISGIQPPVFGLDVVRVGDVGNRALVVVVPPSVDVPHMIIKGEYYGAPVRNHADTEWMSERQIEAAYRRRFEERRAGDRAVQDLYDETAIGRDVEGCAWLILVAQPTTPIGGTRLDDQGIREILKAAEPRAFEWVWRGGGVHPLESVDRLNPRRGMRRWVLVNEMTGIRAWREAWFAIHDSGAVSLAQAIGGHRVGGGDGSTLYENQIRSSHVECSVGDFMAVLRETTTAIGTASEFDLILGIDWAGRDPLLIETVDGQGFRSTDTSIPLARFVPVRTSIRTDVDDNGWLAQAYDVAQDAVNQGGIQNLQAMKPPVV